MYLFYFILMLVSSSDGYNILVSTPNAVKSESTTVFEIASGLAEAGHHVTYITAFNTRKTHKNLNVVWLEEVEKASNKMFEENNGILYESISAFFGLLAVFYKVQNGIIWQDERVRDIWEKRKEYDLMLSLTHYNEGSFAFLIDNPIPLVLLCTPGAESFTLSRSGNWITPAVMPSLFDSYDENMNFWERSMNLWSTLQFYYLQRKIALEYLEPVQEVFPSYGHYSSYYDRVSLTLLGGNFALDSSVPLLPSQLEIGTINIKKTQPLPTDLEAFIDSSGEAGVIIFSLGSIAKSEDISPQAKEMFVEAFRRVPQKVLWKYEGTDLILPPNVMIMKWLPQQDILAHPKTRVFISHCGNLGTQEAKYYGVPVLGVPIMLDQPRNAVRMEKKGFSITLPWEDMTADKIVEALNTLVNDTSYRARLKSLSAIVQDQKERPLEKAIWWMEYVIRHKGAPHLDYAGKRLSLFQYLMLDVLLFWLALLCVLILSVVYAIRAICCRKKKGAARDNLNNRKKEQKKKQ